MADTNPHHVFLSYNRTHLDFVQALAARLREVNVSLWFSPWHAIPGRPVQEQMEQALWQASARIVFIGGRILTKHGDMVTQMPASRNALKLSTG